MTTLVRRLRAEGGYSLIEMLTVIAIMGIVMAGLTTVFVGASKAELDMNRRFEAQQETRVALDKLRREIHCSQSAMTTPSTGAAPLVTLTLPSQCPTAGGMQTSVSWCSVGVSSGRWAVYRKAGTACDATGVKWSDYLTQADLFEYQASSTTSLARLRVSLPIDIKLGDATPAYTLCDQIVLRNSTRTGTGGTTLPAC